MPTSVCLTYASSRSGLPRARCEQRARQIQALAGHSTLSKTLPYMHLAPPALCEGIPCTPTLGNLAQNASERSLRWCPRVNVGRAELGRVWAVDGQRSTLQSTQPPQSAGTTNECQASTRARTDTRSGRARVTRVVDLTEHQDRTRRHVHDADQKRPIHDHRDRSRWVELQ